MHTSQENVDTIKVNQKIDQFRQKIPDPAEQVDRAMGGALFFLKEQINSKGIKAPTLEEKAQQAVDEGPTTDQGRWALVDTLEKLSSTSEEAALYLGVIKPHTAITLADGRKVGYDKWRALGNPSDAKFSFPEKSQNPEPLEQAQTAPEAKSTEDVVIETQISSYSQKVKAGQEKGANVKKEEKTLAALKMAAQANGEAGLLLKLRALRMLRADGIGGLEAEIARLEAGSEACNNALIENLNKNGVSNDVIEELKAGKLDIANLVVKGLPEIDGLDYVIFGRELNEEELEKMLETQLSEKEKITLKQRGKRAGKYFLLTLLYAAVEAATGFTHQK